MRKFWADFISDTHFSFNMNINHFNIMFNKLDKKSTSKLHFVHDPASQNMSIVAMTHLYITPNARKGPLCNLRKTQALISLRKCAADLDLRSLLTKSMDIVVYVMEQRLSRSDCKEVHALLDLHCSQIEQGSFFPTMRITSSNKSRGTAFLTIFHERSAKTQISLRIPAVWSVFAVYLKTLWILGYPQSDLRIVWSDCAEAQADLSLRWVHMQSGRK